MSNYNIPEPRNTNNFSATADVHSESVEVLREKLNNMKRIMNERNTQQQQQSSGYHKTEEIWTRPRKQTGIIDGNFLSLAFGAVGLVILTVSIYAFYNLYNAILKKFPSRHEEL